MHSYDYWLIIAFFAVVLVPAPFLGRFYYKVMEGQRTWLSPVLGPVEKVCYRIAGVDPAIMGIGPVPATRRCLDEAGWTLAAATPIDQFVHSAQLEAVVDFTRPAQSAKRRLPG